jgi:K(+)-stimulated pyrophosphate-energized sodium pump
VMNLVAVLVAPAVVKLTVGEHESTVLRILIGIVCVAIIAAAVIVSKRRRISMGGPAINAATPVGGGSGGGETVIIDTIETNAAGETIETIEVFETRE